MAHSLTGRQLIAFKIGARARKFLVEGCPIEGYDYLYACLADARETDPELYALLQIEAEKLEQRVARAEETDSCSPSDCRAVERSV